VRITSREGAARDEIEAAGAECWPGTPDRLATLRGALDGVTILEFFLTQAIDTTVRGLVFETRGPAAALADGESIVHALTERNAIPLELLRTDPLDLQAWRPAARAAVERLLGTSR